MAVPSLKAWALALRAGDDAAMRAIEDAWVDGPESWLDWRRRGARILAAFTIHGRSPPEIAAYDGIGKKAIWNVILRAGFRAADRGCYAGRYGVRAG